jgi:hydrogenase-4 component E
MSYEVVNILGCLLVLTSLIVVLVKSPKSAAYMYGIQSMVLVCIFISLATVTGSTELYTWSGTAFLTKVLFVPAVMLYTYKKMGSPTESVKPAISPGISIVLAVIELAVCFAVVGMIELPTSEEVKPALAVSLALFFIGLTCIISQRNIMKQVFGYCLMENGSHLTLALLAPTAPEIVEIGIATDAIFAVLIMAFVVFRVQKSFNSLDADNLGQLKG